MKITLIEPEPVYRSAMHKFISWVSKVSKEGQGLLLFQLIAFNLLCNYNNYFELHMNVVERILWSIHHVHHSLQLCYTCCGDLNTTVPTRSIFPNNNSCFYLFLHSRIFSQTVLWTDRILEEQLQSVWFFDISHFISWINENPRIKPVLC